VTCALQIPWCWWSVYQGRTWCVGEPLSAAACLLAVLVALAASNWLWQVVRITML
jgi:hypothetical protein